MALPKRILVPTDFSEASDAALDYAVALAKHLGATIVLLHAFRPPALDLPEGALAGVGAASDRILRAAEKTLASAVACHEADGVPIEPLIRRGTPWRVIVGAARELDRALIVMGTGGRGGVLGRAVQLGSVAEKVVRMAPCPALTIPAHAA